MVVVVVVVVSNQCLTADDVRDSFKSGRIFHDFPVSFIPEVSDLISIDIHEHDKRIFHENFDIIEKKIILSHAYFLSGNFLMSPQRLLPNAVLTSTIKGCPISSSLRSTGTWNFSSNFLYCASFLTGS